MKLIFDRYNLHRDDDPQTGWTIACSIAAIVAATDRRDDRRDSCCDSRLVLTRQLNNVRHWSAATVAICYNRIHYSIAN